MSVLFISHSSSDNDISRELEEQLAAQGHHSVFLDLDPEKGIVAGQSWEQTLYTKLRACRAVVALCTDSYLQSHWCFAEIALARMEGKHIFTLLADPFSGQTKLPSILTETQYIDLRTNGEEGYKRLWRGFKEKGIEAAEAREWNPKDPPYPGLLAFQEKDAPIFFGRERETDEGIELLNRVKRQGHPRLVMTLGASGSGKSSLVRAGLLPRLRRDVSQWLLVDPFRPGAEPDRELAAVLSRAFEQVGHSVPWTTIHERLQRAMGQTETAGQETPEVAAPVPAAEEAVAESEPFPFVEAVQELEARLPEGADQRLVRYLRLLREAAGQPGALRVDGHPGAAAGLDGNPLLALATDLRLWSGRAEARVLLVIDQFEELLGHEASDHAANRFLTLLRDALEAEGSPLLALGTMRSDFLGLFQQNAPLQGVGFKSLSLGPVPTEGMRKIIEEPATLGAIQLENGLTDLLLADTGTSDALPLLAFTLRVMWDKYIDFDAGDRLLEVREYQELGGLQGAMAQEADAVLEAALKQGTEEDLRNAFLKMARMTEEGGFARRPINWDALPERVRPMLKHFVNQRLLISRGDGTVEVAHEALFRSWDRLVRWLEQSAEALHLRHEIQLASRSWEQGDRAEEYLWKGGRLARAEELIESGDLPLEASDREFVEASHKAERALIEAEEARRQRELEQAQALAAEQARVAKRTRIFSGVVGVAFLFAVGLGIFAFFKSQEAATERDVARMQARRAMANQLSGMALGSLSLDRNPTRAFQQAAMALELDTANVTAVSTLIKSWLGQGAYTFREKQYAQPFYREIAGSGLAQFFPDGNRIAVSSSEDSVSIFTLEGVEVETIEAGALPFSMDIYKDPEAWTTSGIAGTEFLTFERGGINDGFEIDVVWSPDRQYVAAVDDADHTFKVWDVQGTVFTTFLRDEGEFVLSSAFSPDGRYMATASTSNNAALWDLQDRGYYGEPRLLATLQGHTDWVEWVTFSPDGTMLLTRSRDGSLKTWDLTAHPLPQKTDLPSVASALNDTYTVTSEAGVVMVSDARTGQEVARKELADEQMVFSFDFARISADGRYVYAWESDPMGGDAAVYVWDRQKDTVFTLDTNSSLQAVHVSPATGWIVTKSIDSFFRFWDLEGQEIFAIEWRGSNCCDDLHFSQDGRYLVVDNQVWPIDPALLIEQARQAGDQPLSAAERQQLGIDEFLGEAETKRIEAPTQADTRPNQQGPITPVAGDVPDADPNPPPRDDAPGDDPTDPPPDEQ